MQRKRWLVLSSWVIVIAVGLLIWHHHGMHEQPPKQAPELVQAVHVAEAKMPIIAKTVGSLVATQSVKLTPEAAGKVAKLFFTDGAEVTANAALVQLDDAVDRAKFMSADANYKLSETTFKRLKLLAREGIITQQALEKAHADMVDKQASASEYQTLLTKMCLRAPFSGRLAKAEVGVGDYITPGQAVVTLTDTKHLRVEYDLPANNLGLIKLGQAVTVTTSAYPHKKFAGKVAFIAPTLNVQNRTVALYADIPNDNELLAAGLFVNVQQNLGADDKALTIPVTALMPTIDGQEVLRVVADKLESVAVQTGLRSATSVQITSGLKLGDTVVIAGLQKVKPGDEVNVEIIPDF